MNLSNMKPEILTHPNIPKPLHGINPRSIMWQDWWDKKRQEAYKSTDYHCVACGVHKSEAKWYKWLEAHEYYNIDYDKWIVTITSIEPLCHYCHNFIHSGRLSMIMGNEKTEEEVKDILKHGLDILKRNNLKCFWFTLEFSDSLWLDTSWIIPAFHLWNTAKWEDWKLIFEWKEYWSNFANISEWKKHYNN